MPAFVGQKHRPPATFSDAEVMAYAHCPDPRCDGTAQEQVIAVKTHVEASFASRDGDWPFTENTYDYLNFASEDDRQCKVCVRRDRELSEQERPVYQPLSGFAQDGLLHARRFDPQVRNTAADEAQAAEAAELRKQLAEMREQMQEFMEANKRRPPGRPPKDA